MIVCAGRNETFDFAHPIGVGLIESTMNLTKIMLTQKPDSLLFIGSAGSYGKHKIFDIVTSQTAANIELGFLEEKCYTPLEKIISNTKKQDVSHETKIIVNSSNYITSDWVSSQKFLTLGVELENMEFFALQNIAKEYNISAYGIFIVTNYCDENAHKDFIKNHTEAKQLLTKYMKDKDLLNKS
jgi:nucleoside phosphorylase